MKTLRFAFGPCIAIALAAGAEPPAPWREPQGADLQAKVKPPEQPTAEDILRTLQRRRPVNAAIPPGSRLARDAAAANSLAQDPLLMPEGWYLVDRTGRLTQEGQWWVFTFDDDLTLPTMKLLPNAALEQMVRTVYGASDPVRFTITGEVTVFKGENYLLPRSALRAIGAGDVPVPKKGSAPAAPRVRPDAPADEVLAAMRAQQPTEAVLFPGDSTTDEKKRMWSTGYTGSFLPDESPVVNRVGRILRQGPWWTFVSDSDRPDQTEPPLRLLPNQGVELMIKESQRGGGGMVFVVSGEAMLFDRENYLLIRIATRRVDTGNLRR